MFVQYTATAETYTLSLHDALPISLMHQTADIISTEFRAKYYATLHPDGSTDWYRGLTVWSGHDTNRWSRLEDRKSTRLNSSHSSISYAVFCLKKKTTNTHDRRARR